MALCGCGYDCNCLVTAGDGVIVTGTGTDGDPYEISASLDPGVWEYRDTATVDLTKTGTGSGADPNELTAEVKLRTGSGLSPTGGLGVQIDPAPGNSLITTADGLRTEGAITINPDPRGGLKTAAEGIGIKLDPASTSQVTLSSAGLRVDESTEIEARFDFQQFIGRGQMMMMGGGERQANVTHALWGQPFIFIPPHKAGDAGSSYYNIGPVAGGLTIKGYGGASNKTVPVSGNFAAMVPLPDWHALWYLVPTYNTSAEFIPGNLLITSYEANIAPTVLPDNAVLIAYRDGFPGKRVHWADGQVTAPWSKMPGLLQAYGGTVGLGTGGVQSCMYRYLDEIIQIHYYYQWGNNALTPKGELWQPMPFTAAPSALERNNHTVVGLGRLYSTQSGTKQAMEWQIQPIVYGGGDRMYFLSPAAGNDVRLGWMRVHDGTGSIGTGRPYIAEGFIDTAGTEFTGQIDLPLRGAFRNGDAY